MKSAPTIAFDFQPCRGIALAVGIMTVLAVCAVLLSGLDTAAKVLLAFTALSVGMLGLRRHLNPGIVRIARGAGGWLLVDRQGNDLPVALIAHAQRGFLLVLDFHDDGAGQRRRFVLTPDNIDAELRRRLTLVLAVGEQSASAKA